MMSSQPGRCTFSATSAPFTRSRARYTCPIEAAAMGPGCTSSKTSSKGRPRSSATTWKASASLKGGTWSCSFCSSTRYSLGSRSGREASACPALIMAGPKPVRIFSSCSARICRFASSWPVWMSLTMLARKRVSGTNSSTLRTSHLAGCLNSWSSLRFESYTSSGWATAFSKSLTKLFFTSPVTSSFSKVAPCPTASARRARAFNSRALTSRS
mmetsp:Transcript_3096/g.4343  ORF Transcript_3096/g.4343 Transcript_3096/m.4343 type:complete len:213 (+) Transcript_3096:1119-1757(+)